jgi:hypothetical protein
MKESEKSTLIAKLEKRLNDMGSFTGAILNALKAKYISVYGKKQFDDSMDSPQGAYYLATLDDNLVEQMDKVYKQQYENGSGKELDRKMRSLRSSSAMTFNMLGNHSIKMKTNELFSTGTYSIEYEKQLPTLKTNKQPANLDAFLLCPDNHEGIFCEMKMTEWLFNSPGTLKSAYLLQDNYFYPDSFQTFEAVFQSLIDCPTDYDSENNGIFERYDAFQMMKHTLAIYNVLRRDEGEFKDIKKVTLVNCVWTIEHPERLDTASTEKYKKCYLQEQKEFYEFRKRYQPIIELFSGLQISFDMIFLPFWDFVKNFDRNSDNLLQRYLI